jgi:hypothetical protein
VVRGPFPAAALSLLQPADLLLVATAAAGVPLAPARTLWVDYDGSPAARDALAIAQRAADTLRARLHVMLHGKDVPTCARLRAQAQAALGPAARAARIDTAYPASALLRIAPRELLDDDALARYEGAVLLVG